MKKTLVHRVLVVDDTPGIHEDFRKVFQKTSPALAGLDHAASALFGDSPTETPDEVEFEIESAFQGREGAERVSAALQQDRPYSIAFVDMRMPPGWDGVETIQALWKIDPRLQVVICTAHSDRSWHEIRTALGPSDSLIILKKPFDHSEARQLAHALGEKWSLARENELRMTQLNELLNERTHALKVAEDRFSRAFEANPHAQALIALNPFEILEINPAFTRQFGLRMEDLRHTTPENFGRAVNGERWRQLLARLAANESFEEHAFNFERSPNDIRALRCSASPLTIGNRPCSIWLVRDVTEHHRLEQQFLQSQKMEAVGQLAAGIAHDFNNLLTIIQGYTDLALDDLDPTQKSGLILVRQAAERAAALTRQLLVFSRREAANPTPLDVGATVQGMRNMLTRLVPERIRVVWSVPSALPEILADASHLEQAVMNLVINARDAMSSHGLINVELRVENLTEAQRSRHAKARPGSYVVLSVADTGCGMPPEVLARIFEPFFTTKESGKGTGLGLCTVYGIADQHGGWIEVNSTVGLGSTFDVFFPALSGSTSPRSVPVEHDLNNAALRGRGQRILIVEDEAIVRAAAVAIATRAGYQVAEAADGFAALALWKQSKQPFDLVFSDVVMPNGLSGPELVQHLRRERPELKAILTTGYTDQLLRAELTERDAVLVKPYAAMDLVTKLHEILVRPTAASPRPEILSGPIVAQ